MKKLLFVYNPHSGKGQIVGKIGTIVEILTKAGYFVTIYPTQRALDGYDIVCAADGQYDLIVCSGGDGTLDEVVTGMNEANLEIPLGYIPAGSTNDFASSIGIPSDMVKAAKIAVGKKSAQFDVGQFNEDTFV